MEFLTDLGQDVEIMVRPTRKQHGEMSGETSPPPGWSSFAPDSQLGCTNWVENKTVDLEFLGKKNAARSGFAGGKRR